MLTITPVLAERATFHTGAGALATSTKNTPVPTAWVARYSSAMRCLRSPALQKTTGTLLAAPQALTRRANRPAIRIRWVLSSSASLSSCSRRHHTRNPPGLYPSG
ncbi:hypothetical protein BMW24_005465 [Mycobacterium heckeshornense]|uniref:hypothetical protein n=1 Tax=Mycobacterium heckeshornense TaxID=110505 RepID=UPI0008FD7897|nr:hypothetical protein [Mycobacterium heckeshornense]PIJ36166.1 hypothetical protein BMW24_005465 [Mycobacterium heckeshornense]